ncbi:MAG TPA: hypothetical protein VJG13_11710, partial [Thermoanaerobaculia bacterium]|nr:hypothetical protein [Thermoanaerobaculia bacterium]
MLAFERIEIRRLPGFERGGFELRGLSPGINLLHGPQAAGKSTTARVLAGLLWPDDGIGVERWEEASVSATAWIDGRRWEIDAAHARPRYQEEGEPRERLPVPGGELSDRYSLALHDLLQAGADDGAFARLIARELAGGFDLDEALHAVEAKEKPGRATKESKALKEALDAFRETEARQIELAGEAAKLDRLRADEAAAHAAARELEDLLALATWRRCQERLALEERALEEGFGPIRSAMERVAPTDLERLDRLGARLAAAELDLERKREAMRQTETRLREAALPPEGVPRAVFGALGQEQKALLAEEAALAEGESALARFRELREDARHALGEAAGDDETLRALPAGAWGPLLELAAAAERVRARQAQLDGLEDWLGGVEPPPDLPSLTEGINRLRRWLRASASSWRPALLALVVAFLLAAFGAWAGAQGEPAFWGLAALGAAGASWALLDLLRSRVERRTAAREYTALGIEAPARWAAGAVEPLLARLELRRAEALLEAEKAARYQEANARRRRLDEQEAELAARRRALVDELGLATVVTADLGEAPLAVLAQALCAWRVADSEVR